MRVNIEGVPHHVKLEFIYECVSEPPRGRVSAELSKPVKRKGAMCIVLV